MEEVWLILGVGVDQGRVRVQEGHLPMAKTLCWQVV